MMSHDIFVATHTTLLTSISARSYVCPSIAHTGSTMISNDIGQKKAGCTALDGMFNDVVFGYTARTH